MDDEIEFQKLGVKLESVRSVVTEQGSSGAVILTDGAAVMVEHSPGKASAITLYLRSLGIPIYKYDDDIPDECRPDASEVTVTPA